MKSINYQYITRIIYTIPPESWTTIMKMDPVWKYLEEFHEKYHKGKFCVLLMMLALNAYQLKGKAELKYWFPLQCHIKNYDAPEDLKDLEYILEQFYSKERLPTGKLKRLSTFLSSNLSKTLWNGDLDTISKDFKGIWYELSKTMKQKSSAKTIVFSMKCLGMSLYIKNYNMFNFDSIPIPVDSRIRRFTEKILQTSTLLDSEIQLFWDSILSDIKNRQPKISMIHLDSFIWQIEPLNNDTFKTYCNTLGITNC